MSQLSESLLRSQLPLDHIAGLLSTRGIVISVLDLESEAAGTPTGPAIALGSILTDNPGASVDIPSTLAGLVLTTLNDQESPAMVRTDPALVHPLFGAVDEGIADRLVQSRDSLLGSNFRSLQQVSEAVGPTTVWRLTQVTRL